MGHEAPSFLAKGWSFRGVFPQGPGMFFFLEFGVRFFDSPDSGLFEAQGYATEFTGRDLVLWL